jgi:5-(carboxyamino)imidazole ribonucleotide synthase
MTGALLPGARLGVLGGGQLGRMFALAARRLGYRVGVLAPGSDGPAGQVADLVVDAAYDDLAAVEDFARQVDVLTFEFENVSAAAVEAAARHVPVRPAGSFLHLTQDRAREKEGLRALGLPTAPFAVLREEDDLAAAAKAIGFPAILKTSSWGYDGLGQRRIEDAGGLAAAWEDLDRLPCVLEGLVPFVEELSVVGARGVDGDLALYEPVLNRHERHILDLTLCPAPVAAATLDAAHDIARTILEVHEVVGVLCVELFLLAGGALVVNEIAPRPHNSGHLTIDAHACSQFEQQVRAVCGLPLGSTARRAPAAAMANLLGDLWLDGTPDWSAVFAAPGVALHLYGKTEARRGRKMGHLTVVDEDLAGAERRALAARAALTPVHEEAG